MLTIEKFCKLVKVEEGPLVRFSYPVCREVPANYYDELVKAYGEERTKRMIAGRMYRDYVESAGLLEFMTETSGAISKPCDSVSDLRKEMSFVIMDFEQRIGGGPYA